MGINIWNWTLNSYLDFLLLLLNWIAVSSMYSLWLRGVFKSE